MVDELEESLVYSEDEMQAISSKWSEVYTAFLDGVEELTKLTGGKGSITFEMAEEGNIKSIWPTYHGPQSS